MRFKTPEVRAETPKAGLHFIGNAETSGGPHVSVHFGQIAGWKYDLPRHAWQCLCDVRRDSPSFPAQAIQDFRHVTCVHGASVRVAAPVWPPVIIRKGSHVHPRFAAAASGAVELIWADVNERARVAMIGVLEDDDILASSVGARETQRKLVGFAAGVQEIADAEGQGQQAREAFRVTDDVVVQVARVRIEQRDLLLHRANDPGVAVPHKRHVVVHIQECAASVVVEVLHPSAHDFQWTLVGNAEISSEQFAAGGKRRLAVELARRETFGP